MEDVKVEELAGELYETYSEAVGGVAFNNDPLPKWAEFSVDENKTKQAGGWRAVASRVIAKGGNTTAKAEDLPTDSGVKPVETEEPPAAA